MNNHSNTDQGKNLSSSFKTESEILESEMDEFFAMREAERSANSSYSSQMKATLDANSGCCMTGCAGCPWGYEIPAA
jgi:hypothetical protein